MYMPVSPGCCLHKKNALVRNCRGRVKVILFTLDKDSNVRVKALFYLW